VTDLFWHGIINYRVKVKKETMELKEMHCEPVSAGTEPLTEEQVNHYMEYLPVEWRVYESKRLAREFPFENFKRGMAFAQEIGRLAEEEQHHPGICVEYSQVVVELSTHDIGGLSINDFIMAAKIEDI